MINFELLLSIGWFCVVLALLLKVRHLNRSLPELSRSVNETNADLPSVTIIVPARNEAHQIERCLASLLAQDYPAGLLHIVVVDDDSTDTTAKIAHRLAVCDTRLRVIHAPPLPESWIGKANACWYGAQLVYGEWLCFMDADTEAEPSLLRCTVNYALQYGVDFVSLHPFQELASFWERAVIPEGFLLIGVTIDPARINSPAYPDAAANGQFILVRHGAYFAVQGHAGEPDAILDDVSLARRVKQAGYRIALLSGPSLVRTRMYQDVRSLWEGTSKNAAELMASQDPLRSVLMALGMAMLGVLSVALPLATLVAWLTLPGWSTSIAAAASWTASVILFSIHIFGAIRILRLPWYNGLLMPLGLLATAVITVNSLWRHLRQRNTWKGRVLPR